MVLLNNRFAAIPQNPEFTQVLPLNYNQTLAHYHLQWNAPPNTDSTSIDHYILSIGSRNISVHSTQTDNIVAVNLTKESRLRVFAVDRCNQTGSYDYIQVNQSGLPRVTDCPLSTMASSESTSIVLYTILALTGATLFMNFSTCISVILCFTVSAKRVSSFDLSPL